MATQIRRLLDGVSDRTLRRVGAAIVLLGIPSIFVFWHDQGPLWAILVLGLHLYLGGFIAFALPRLRRSGTEQ
jgi:hypothetical protein